MAALGGVQDAAHTVDHLLNSLFQAAFSIGTTWTDDPGQRVRQILLLRHLHAGLQSLASTVAGYGYVAETLYQTELQSVAVLCQKEPDAACQNGTCRNGGGRNGACAACRNGAPTAQDAAPALRSPPGLTPDAAGVAPHGGIVSSHLVVPCRTPHQRIPVANGLCLDAIVVFASDPREAFAAVRTADLYFIAPWDHFAVRVGGVVFHGNVGRIFPTPNVRPRRTPERVKECRHRAGCPSLWGGGACSYYHDPAEAHYLCRPARAQDVRNFFANSWNYLPAKARGAQNGLRRIGSREALESDLRDVSAVDARRYLAQTAHDILCSLILAKYVLAS